MRTKDGVEVDFAVVKDEIIEEIIEVKSRDDSISKSLRTFKEKYGYKATQLVLSLRNEYQTDDISVLKLGDYLSTLYL